MKSRELRTLRGLPGCVGWLGKTWEFLVLLGLFSLVGIALMALEFSANLVALGSVLVAAAIAFRRRKCDPNLMLDLAERTTIVHRLVVARCIEMEEYEDSGPGWLLDVGDKTLLLEGQYLYYEGEDYGAPSTRVDCAMARHSGVFFGCEWSGEKLEVKRLGFDCSHLREALCDDPWQLCDGVFIEMKLDEVLDIMAAKDNVGFADHIGRGSES